MAQNDKTAADKAAADKAAADKTAAELAAQQAAAAAAVPSNPPAPPGAMGHVNGADGQPIAISYPKKGKRGTQQRIQTEQMRAIWADSKVAMCADPKCFYPLRQRLDPTTNDPVSEETAQGSMLVGECSWDPRHAGGKQLYKPAKRNFLPEDTATAPDEDEE